MKKLNLDSQPIRKLQKWDILPDPGEHGGADKRVKDNFFKPNQDDLIGQRAGSRAGIMSSLIGIAAVKSINSGDTVKIKDLIQI